VHGRIQERPAAVRDRGRPDALEGAPPHSARSFSDHRRMINEMQPFREDMERLGDTPFLADPGLLA
jgi:hypothetical protein